MIIEIRPHNPDTRVIEKVANVLRKGGVMIYPTDSVYAFGCLLGKKSAEEQLCRLKEVKPKQTKFSIMCNSLSQVSEFTSQYPRTTYKILNKNLPGPFTFILKTNKESESVFGHKRPSVGIRVPDSAFILALIEELGHPIITSSIHHEDEFIDYVLDPDYLADKYGRDVDIVIDGGYGNMDPSTVVDLTTDEPEILREGKGELQ